jgi:hypothetical protein
MLKNAALDKNFRSPHILNLKSSWRDPIYPLRYGDGSFKENMENATRRSLSAEDLLRNRGERMGWLSLRVQILIEDMYPHS